MTNLAFTAKLMDKLGGYMNHNDFRALLHDIVTINLDSNQIITGFLDSLGDTIMLLDAFVYSQEFKRVYNSSKYQQFFYYKEFTWITRIC